MSGLMKHGMAKCTNKNAQRNLGTFGTPAGGEEQKMMKTITKIVFPPQKLVFGSADFKGGPPSLNPPDQGVRGPPLKI